MKINKVLFQIIMLFVVSCSVSEVAGNVIFTSDNSHALTCHNVDVDGRRSAVFCIYPDSRGIVCIGTSRGLYLYDGSTSRRVGGKALSGSQIYAIVEYADRLYIGTNHGLKVYDCGSGKTEEPVSGHVGEVRCMSRKDSHLFVGGLNGVYCMDLRSGEMKNISSGLPHSSVYSLLIDSRGVIYAGTYAGLARYDAYASRFYKVDSPVFAKSSKSAFVNCMVESKDGHTIYVGTGEGLYTYQPSHERWGSVGGLSGAIVKSIARNASGEILVGTSGGLYYDDAGTLSHYKRDTRNSGSLSGDQIWCVMTDKDDNIWLGTEHGMSIASNSSVCRFIKISSLISLRMGKELSNNYVNSMVADKDGNLWILLYDDSNIYRYNVTGKKIRRIDVRKVSGGMPSHMCLDSRGRLWCAYDGGALVIDRNGGTVDVKFPHTGDDAAVLTMAPVGTGVWVSTLNNMWNIDGNTLVPSAVPVPRYAFTAIWDDAGSGKVILGALDEIVEVDKASLSKAQEIGTVRLVMECPEGDDIRLNNLVGNPAGLSVAYDKNVSLLVSTLDYSPDVVQHIEYRLVRKSSDGSEEWIAMPEGAGMISLTGMSPGDYDIQIKTVGSPQSPVVIPLRVGYPYYLSVWAVSLYVLLLLSVIGCILWYVRRRGMRERVSAKGHRH
ncbi:ligand-binding sensor domain-containing protein [Leyella lascolaii]|uniref:ligand-binding sensor domain-containing protein n=1 Tax=Leyella lascolaii TaxID=1776379 RepID=UPI0013D9FACA|nr:two-component regulator propeller domain-containing protein [Leyella lascolaii]